MINDYVIKLIENLPDDLKNSKTPLRLDLVLDGGMFNGSYLVGALYFLKEMEKRNYITIERISGCSIGSAVAILYFIDALDMMSPLYDIVKKEFKNGYKLPTIKELKIHLKDRIPSNICEKVNGKLYICYNNIKKGKKMIKSSYKDIDEIFDTIIKSSFIPYLIDGNFLYDNKYIDGMNPYIFNNESGKKILYLDLYGYDKIGNLLNVKNENSNFHRILSGLLDIHNFYIKQSDTQMCSYVNDWSVNNKTFNYLKILFEKIMINFIYILIYFKSKILIEYNFENTFVYKIISKISQDIFIILLETYCL
jgi:hypothetical protein